ncbi:MAG: hypothetical protein ACJA1H_001666 [Glaciecola sp.]|jgi:hypothetical protein
MGSLTEFASPQSAKSELTRIYRTLNFLGTTGIFGFFRPP